MFNLIKWELSHIFRQKSIYIFVILIILSQLNGAMTYLNHFAGQFVGYDETAEQMKGTISERDLKIAEQGPTSEDDTGTPEFMIYENIAYAGIIQQSNEDRLVEIEQKLETTPSPVLEKEKEMREQVDVMYWNQHRHPKKSSISCQ